MPRMRAGHRNIISHCAKDLAGLMQTCQSTNSTNAKCEAKQSRGAIKPAACAQSLTAGVRVSYQRPCSYFGPAAFGKQPLALPRSQLAPFDFARPYLAQRLLIVPTQGVAARNKKGPSSASLTRKLRSTANIPSGMREKLTHSRTRPVKTHSRQGLGSFRFPFSDFKHCSRSPRYPGRWPKLKSSIATSCNFEPETGHACQHSQRPAVWLDTYSALQPFLLENANSNFCEGKLKACGLPRRRTPPPPMASTSPHRPTCQQIAHLRKWAVLPRNPPVSALSSHSQLELHDFRQNRRQNEEFVYRHVTCTPGHERCVTKGLPGFAGGLLEDQSHRLK